MVKSQAAATRNLRSAVCLIPAGRRLLQRQCACGQHTGGEQCEECKKKKQVLQRNSNGSAGHTTAPPIVHEVLRSPGQPLDAETQHFMGTRFHGDFSRVPVHSQTHLTVNSPRDSYEQEADHAADRVVGEKSSAPGPMRDFSQVRVHVGPPAAESARQVSALAYTVGSHIVFGDGQYAPLSPSGRRLLGHELAHVIQQGSEMGQAVQTQVLQRDDDDDESGGAEGKEKKPKSPFDPPDQLGKCSVDILHPEKFVNCCTEAIGDGKICTNQIRSYIDLLRKYPCPEPAKRPDGTCCPLPMIWDGLKDRCSKTLTALGTHPIAPPPSQLCLPTEKPNLYGGCCKPGDKVDKNGRACIPDPPVFPIVPSDKPLGGSPSVSGGAAVAPPGKLVLHFNLDKPPIKVAADESSLLESLTAGGKSDWTSLVAQLKANPSWKFQLVGKASPEGPATYNLDLGKRRAQLVVKALMDQGIDRSRIVEVAPECTKVETGIYTCGETDAAGPEDRQVKVVFSGASGATP
jgi:Domain of unknown function (DUF4157)